MLYSDIKFTERQEFLWRQSEKMNAAQLKFQMR